MNNQIPSSPSRHRLAIILEGPSAEDTSENKHLHSSSGRLLAAVLSNLGLPIGQLFIGYVSPRKSTPIYHVSENSPGVAETTEQLFRDLHQYRPNCCLLLGDLVSKIFGAEHPPYTQRGTIFVSPVCKLKCISTFEPGFVMRAYDWFAPWKFDVNRAKEQSLFPEHRPPIRRIESMPTFSRLVELMEEVIRTKPPIALDLEGHPNQVGVTCYSIATNPNHIFIVPFRNMDNTPLWTLDQEITLWKLTDQILSDPLIPKTCQNAMYELFVFAWRHGILIQGVNEDTMFKMWELYSELPKGLDFISSFFTEEPYYKSDRTVPELDIHHTYCCKDSAVTLESSEKMDVQLAKNQPSLDHYKFNISLLRPYLYMQLRGCKLDLELINRKRSECWARIQAQQDIVNQMTGRVFNVKSAPQKSKYLYEELGLPPQYEYKAGKKEITTNFGALATLYTKTELPVVLEIAKLVRLRTRFSDLNKLSPFSDGRIRSSYNPVGTETGRLSSSETWVEALFPLPKIEFKTRSVNKQKVYEMQLVETQKLINLGTNLQNVTKDLRDCFIPDSSDFSFFQYDLSGADAWTVAADCAALGNDRMLVHLQNKIKPSMVIVLLTEYGQEVYKWSLEKLKEIHDATLKSIKSTPRLVKTYTCAKSCQHGTNYGMQPPLMASLQLERSVAGWVDNFNAGITDPIDFKAIHPHVMESYQKLYINYYGLQLRNEYIRKQLTNFGYLDAACGTRRRFLGIRNRAHIDDATLRIAASNEPQANTTYCTNAALRNMYYDPENRTARGFLRCEPLLMVHDSLAGQAHFTQVSWATDKMKEWFHIPLTIHGIELTIPVEGGWGTSWKDTD